MDTHSGSTERLTLDGISCTFGSVQAVRDVSLSVSSGEIVCLLGPSGCGKTTTLRVSAGVARQTAGRVLIDGKVVSSGSVHAPPEHRTIGLMFQDFALFPHLSVTENVAFGLPKRSHDRSQIVAEYLDRVGLHGFGQKYPHMLSGGEQQRVALARALAPKPKVMLMDEPFSGLDKRLRDEVRDQALAILKAEGAAVLLVTHEPDEAMRMADRIALMRAGRIVQIGAPYDIYNAPVDRAAAAFFSDVNVVHGVVESSQAQTAFGRFMAPGLADKTDVEIIVRPQHLDIHEDRGEPRPAVTDTGVHARGVVERARFIGAQSLIEVRMDLNNALLRATVPYAFLPSPGTALWLGLRHDKCFVFPCETQRVVASPVAAA